MPERLDILEQRLNAHIESTDDRLNRGSEKMDELIVCTSRNSDTMSALSASVSELAANMNQLTDNTEGLVQIYQDVQGAARIGRTVKRIATWLVGIPIIGTGMLTIYEFVLTYIRPGEGMP